MDWRVDGADSKTGNSVCWKVTAATAEEASYEAQQKGVYVSSVTPIAAAPLLEARPYVPEYQPPAQADARPSGRTSPHYREIQTGAGILKFFGNICYLFAFLVLALTLYFGLKAAASPPSPMSAYSSPVDTVSKVAAVAAGLMYAATLAVAGAFLHMNGSLALAVRDIARNSYRW